MTKPILLALVLTVFGVSCATSNRVGPADATVTRTTPLESFPLADVELLESPFRHAQQTNIEYLLTMDPSRLLAPYLREAGLNSPAPAYGNWESSGLDGHIGGHYLSALSLSYAATGDTRLLDRLDYMLAELARAQAANGNGYIGGVPGSAELWADISQGQIDADLFSLNDKWVPWYNLHKVYAGLRDAYLHTGNAQALDMLIKLTDWSLHLVANLSDEQIQTMLRTEYGGMNEVFADVAAFTGEQKYLELARQFSDNRILDPLVKHEDQLTGLHANTQIPKAVGFKRIADVSESLNGQGASWDDAAAFFWDTVVNERSVAIGGNSVREHFHDTDDFSPMVTEPEGPETCNTYNMLRLSQMLFATTASSAYVDYYERALYNHILSSQHPEHGGLVYFTPMRPNHYRMYSQPEEAMWCCVGSGIENHGKYGEFIYSKRGDDLYVNLFIPSRLTWQEKGLVVKQQTNFPDSEDVYFTVESPAKFTLNLRYPRWVDAGELAVFINGERQVVTAEPGDYLHIDRAWKKGDEVRVSLPMQVQLEQLPDASDYYSVLYGPIVLAAKTEPFPGERLNFLSDDSRMGHIAQGPTCPSTAAPVFVSDTPNFADKINRIPGEQLRFKADGVIQNANQDLTLIPFFRLHDSRYMVYWPYSTPEGLESRQEQVSEQEQARRQLEALTIDQVAPGQQQPESDHFFKGEKTEAGIHKGRHWRHAQGWFSYELNDPNREASALRVTYYGLDNNRHFDIFINQEKITTVTLDGSRGDEFFTVDYPLPYGLWQDTANNVLEVKFQARAGSTAGGIYGVRLLKERVNGPAL